MTHETWGTVRAALKRSVGLSQFETWFEPIKYVSTENRIVTFEVPTNFHRSWMSRTFDAVILKHLHAAGIEAERLDWLVNPAVKPATSGAAPDRAACRAAGPAPGPAPANMAAPVVSAPPEPDAAYDDLNNAHRDPRFSFETFVVGKPNELAHAAAQRVAIGGAISFNPLFLHSGVGLGKTHLMHAVANRLEETRPDLRVLYLSADKFMYRFIQAIKSHDTLSFKTLFRSVDVLMVDDVQFIAGKSSTQEEFFHTFNALIDMGKQIVISGDRAPTDMENLDMRITSRLQQGLVIDIHPTDYELRLGILQAKVEAYQRHYPGFRIAPGVLEFVAHRISANVRTLEGALTLLFAFHELVGREVTIDMAQECLGHLVRASDRKVTIDAIVKKVCEHYNIRQSDLMSKSRVRTVARPRQMAMFLAKTLTTKSLPEIGRALGGRDHTTILHGVRKIEELRGNDHQIAEDAEILRRSLED